VKTKDDRRRMLAILNHARPLEGNFQLNYDLRKDNSNPQVNNSITNNSNNNINSTKDSVSLKKCLSSNIKNNNTLNSTEIFSNNNTNNSLPYTEELSDINFAREQNESLIKEKFELEEFYKNVFLKLNEDEKRREEEMRLHIMKMNSHIKYLEQKKQKLENFNYQLNTNFMDLKYDLDLTDKKILKEIDNNKNKNNLLLKGINDSKRKAKLERDLNQKEYNKRSRQVAATLRNQIKTNKETAVLAEKQLNEINKIYEEKIGLYKNKCDVIEEKYKILQEKIYQSGNPQNWTAGPILKNDFEKIMNVFRERMKQHEKYINEIKQMAEGDYDHFDGIRNITQDNNRKFFDDINETEMNLIQFYDEILKAKKEYEKLIPYINAIINTNVNDNENYNEINNN
jgi:hypothetical protein